MPNPDIRLIIERNIPYVAGLLDSYATVRYMSAEDIDAKAVRDCDGLIIRTRTRCDEALLAKSDVKFIATATIGTDHIDLDYCRNRSITVVNAPGCNAPAVAQYVFASVLRLINRPLRSYVIAVVGVGHVGSIVARWARAMGMEVLLYDPLRQEKEAVPAEGFDRWSTLDEIACRADIITYHTPLTHAPAAHATYHMCNGDFLASLRRAPIIINSSRGEVAETAALIKAREQGLVSHLVVDCWEGEPDIDGRLLEVASVATPHIAGYSRQGKQRASQAVLDAATTFFMLPRVTLPGDLPAAAATTVSKAAVMAGFDPLELTRKLKASPQDFEILRNSYVLREEVPQSTDPDWL